jgi:hypothetical protein
LPNSRVLFAGLLAFFFAFSLDRMLHTRLGNWHSGVDPCGFLAFLICLAYPTSRCSPISLLTSVAHFDTERKLADLRKLPEDRLVYARFQAFAFAR